MPDTPISRQPSPAGYSESDRVPGAPAISCSLSAVPQNISLSDKESHFDNICYDITFKYEHPIAGSSTDRRPITLYRPSLFAASTWDILRHSPNGLVKVRHDGFLAIPPAIDGPRLLPLTIYKGDFISLFPGESWSDRVPLDDDELADAFQLAERYRFQFIGAVVQWWDWGTLDDHKATAIREDYTSHDRRPKIIVPASNSFDFTVIA